MKHILIGVVAVPFALATLLAASAASTANAAHAADIKVVVTEVREHGITKIPAVIRVEGKFGDAEADAFNGAAGGIRNAIVYFNSPGGAVRSGVMLGRIIRARGFVTAVANRETCYSACALAWLAGKKRFIGYSAAVGFHAPHGKKWERIPAAEAIVAAYVRYLGFSDATASYVLAADPKDLNFMTNELDGNAHGIALTWLPIPTYTPLPRPRADDEAHHN
jgi:hypothetical protein